jgi:aspartate aminotransferase
VCDRLKAMPGIKLLEPDGAFYAWFSVADHFGKTLGGKKVTDSTSFCAAALETAHVNLVQGSAFGAEGYARLSFATSMEQLQGGMDRLEKLLKG